MGQFLQVVVPQVVITNQEIPSYESCIIIQRLLHPCFVLQSDSASVFALLYHVQTVPVWPLIVFRVNVAQQYVLRMLGHSVNHQPTPVLLKIAHLTMVCRQI